MQKIPGKKIASQILDNLKAEIDDKQLKPKLGVLLVGDDQASSIYVSLKEKAANGIGIQTDVRRLSDQISDHELIKIIKLWNADKHIHGILIQLPLPEGYDADRVIEAMDPKKDVDGFHPKHIADLYAGQARTLSPLHEGILRLISATPVQPNHALTIILANSHTFADPLKYILKKAGADVEVMLSKDKDDKKLRQADIIVVAVGQLNFLTGNGIKPGACVIDVGINKTPDNKVHGDFDSLSCEDLDGWYSPVPGGVGPMTVALLMQNVVKVCRIQNSIL